MTNIERNGGVEFENGVEGIPTIVAAIAKAKPDGGGT